MLNRKELAGTIRDAADKAGTLTAAALGVALAALAAACAALVVALKLRHAG